MGEPERVAECIGAMQNAVNIPVTVKCRIGIEPGMENTDDLRFLQQFVSKVAQVGCRVFVVHARRAVLNGLSPKENREIPPLRYDVVAQVRQLFPELQFVLNGGIRTVNEVVAHLHDFDGVMIGREAYNKPYVLAELHRAFEDDKWVPDRAEVVRAYSDYVAHQLQSGERLNVMIRHILGLYHGLPSARSWRRFLSEGVIQHPNEVNLLNQSLRIVQ
jgi:tRNA-dihydrouridine synthase A